MLLRLKVLGRARSRGDPFGKNGWARVAALSRVVRMSKAAAVTDVDPRAAVRGPDTRSSKIAAAMHPTRKADHKALHDAQYQAELFISAGPQTCMRILLQPAVAAMKYRFHDPPVLPGTALGPAACLARAQPLETTDGHAYVERRGVPVDIATAAGVRFDPDWAGRPAVLIALRDCDDEIRSVHGRYLHNVRGQDKMLTIGPGGGAISVLGGWRSDPLIVVEGLFDALSLAVCGHSAIATIGRDVPWLPSIAAGRAVHIAFDGNRPGEQEETRAPATDGDAPSLFLWAASGRTARWRSPSRSR
jgi:hypothetical protein